MPRTRDLLDEPTMSDATILLTVEDLINRAMGPSDANVVNFKLIQTILHILARQQRMLQQRVEIKIIEIRKESSRKKHADESTEERSSTESPSPAKAKPHKSPQRGDKKDKPSTQDVKDKDRQKDRTDRKEHERDERGKSKEKGGATTPYKTKQMQMMVNKIEEEEEEEEISKERKEQGTIKQMLLKEEKIGQRKSDKMSQREGERRGNEEKIGYKETDKMSHRESEKWETKEKRKQKEPDRISLKENETWEVEEKLGQEESDQLPHRQTEKWEKRDKKGLKEPDNMSKKEREIWEKEGKLGHEETEKISQREKERWKTGGKMGQIESHKMSIKESERWGKEEKRRQKEPDRMSQKEKESWELEVKMGQKGSDQLSYRETQREKEEKLGQRKPDHTSEEDRERWKEEEIIEQNKFEEKEKWKEEEKIGQKKSGKIAQNERERWQKETQHKQQEKIKLREVAKLEDEQEYEKINQKVKLSKEMGERKIYEKIPHTYGEISEEDKMDELEDNEKNKRWENEEKIQQTKSYETSQKEKERWKEEEKNRQREPTKMSEIVMENEEKGVQREPDKTIRKERLKKENVGQRETEEMSQKEREILEKDETFARRVTEKMTRKEREQLEKVYEKTDQMSPKERERWEKGGKVQQTESDKISQKEKEKRDTEKITEKRETENLTRVEKEKWGKEVSVKTERTTQNEKDTLGREKIKEDREKHKQKAGKERSAQVRELDRKKPAQRSSIEITEKIIDNEKILVVGKRQPTRHDAQSSSSIDVVTRSQFDLLEEAVKQLRRVITPSPLQLPDNKQLMNDVMKGTASLPDAMQTLQIDAKLRAAEDAVVRMAGLLTQLAAAGELPDELLEQLEALQPAFAGLRRQADDLYQSGEADQSLPLVGKKSVAIDPRAALSKASRAMDLGLHAAEQGTPDLSLASRPSAMSRASRVSTISATQGIPCVTHEELRAALNDLRDAILKTLNNMTVRASTSAENALHFTKIVADKLDVALQLDDRISTLYSVVGDYSEQLNGFDSGLATQMQSFQDQMAHMRADLHAGLVQLENVNNNAETAAVLELTERFEELAAELDDTLHAHKALAALQAQLGDEMRNLVECMEMLREQKADRDEVLDGLRDKADTSRLAGLLSEVDFAEARADFERRIDLCHEKFTRQDEVWQKAIRALKASTDKKAELVELLSTRDETQCRLQQLNDKIRLLAAALGEPKNCVINMPKLVIACGTSSSLGLTRRTGLELSLPEIPLLMYDTALLTRKLAEGATCGSCHVQALMEPYEAAHGAPRALPALRPLPVGASDEPCITDLVAADPTEDRHICHRWCGGSHTLVTESTRRAPAPPAQLAAPTRKFQDYGDDGRLYMMEEECQPCVECNLLNEEKALEVPSGHHGAGDMSPGREPPLECTCVLTD